MILLANTVNKTCLSVKCDNDLTKSVWIHRTFAGNKYLNVSKIGVGNCLINSDSIVEKVFPLQEHSVFVHTYLSNNIQWILEPKMQVCIFPLLYVYLDYHN